MIKKSYRTLAAYLTLATLGVLVSTAAGAMARPLRIIPNNCPVRSGDSIYPTTVANDGVIAGYFHGKPTATATDPIYGFALDLHGRCTVIHYPGAAATWILDMNDRGDLLLHTQTANENLFFVYRDGSFTPVTSPGVSWGWRPTGIGGEGQVIGWYYGGAAGDGGTLGFIFSRSRYDSLQYTNADAQYLKGITSLTGISDNGTIVGESALGPTESEGFCFSAGEYSTLAYPGARVTSPVDVNDSGDAVGTFEYDGGAGVFTMINGRFEELKYPGASLHPTSINNQGVVVGTKVTAGKKGTLVTKAFIYIPRNKR